MGSTELPKLTLTSERATRALLASGLDHAVAILGVRGQAGGNQIGVYDDALYLCAPGSFSGFNANTDPSRIHPGVACLKTGLWLYKVGIHGLSKPTEHRYTALVQAKEVTVLRDGRDDTGFFGINIHRGGYNTTSSEGCQTIFPDQWPLFIGLVRSKLLQFEQKVVPYLLVENDKLPA